MNLPYSNQAERVVRSFKNLPEANYSGWTEDQVWDAYYHLFQDVYHLKDWILNDDAVQIGAGKKQKNDALNSLIESNPYMKLLQSVVTSMKHLKADHGHIAHPVIDLSWSLGGVKPSPAVSYGDGTHANVNDIHPKALVLETLIAWNQFFKDNGLSSEFNLPLQN